MDPFLGEIRLVGFNFAPQGWALCNGQLLAISANTALFSLLGTFYGGNGISTFALPNLQGRVAVHFGQGPSTSNYVIGETTGQETVALTLNQMPQHSHVANCVPAPGVTPSPAGAYWAEGPNPGGKGSSSPNQYSNVAPTATMNPGALSSMGGNQPFSVLQPLLALNYIIALAGIFPSR